MQQEFQFDMSKTCNLVYGFSGFISQQKLEQNFLHYFGISDDYNESIGPNSEKSLADRYQTDWRAFWDEKKGQIRYNAKDGGNYLYNTYIKGLFPKQLEYLDKISLAWDDTAMPIVACQRSGTIYLRRFVQNQVTRNNFLGDSAILLQNLNYQTESSLRDVYCFYLLSGTPYYRVQRDNFGVEYRLFNSGDSSVYNKLLFQNVNYPYLEMFAQKQDGQYAYLKSVPSPLVKTSYQNSGQISFDVLSGFIKVDEGFRLSHEDESYLGDSKIQTFSGKYEKVIFLSYFGNSEKDQSISSSKIQAVQGQYERTIFPEYLLQQEQESNIGNSQFSCFSGKYERYVIHCGFYAQSGANNFQVLSGKIV